MSLQEKLAVACRILAMQGHNDMIYGHVSALTDTPGQYWIKGSGIGLEEVTEDDLVLPEETPPTRLSQASVNATMNFRFIARFTAPIRRFVASFTRIRLIRRSSPHRNIGSCR